MHSVVAWLFMIQWSFDILSGSSCIIWQSSLNSPTASKLSEKFGSLANRWYGGNRFYGQLSCRHRSESLNLGSPRSWLKIGCSKQRPKTLRQISPRKLQAVISSHPTRYLDGSSCMWHILLETAKGVKKEPTNMAWQRKWKQSNQSETCSLPHHMAWPLRRWASKLYACAAALVARRQPVQLCREASRNAFEHPRVDKWLIYAYVESWHAGCPGTAQPTQPSEDATTTEAVIAAPRSAPDALLRTPWEDTATWRLVLAQGHVR